MEKQIYDECSKESPKWEVESPKIQDYILATSYQITPLLAMKIPDDPKEVTAEWLAKLKEEQDVSTIAAGGPNVAY